MAGILQVIRSVKTMLHDTGSFQTIKVWNNQLESQRNGDDYSFAFPAAFVEIISPSEYNALPEGYTTSDIAIMIHIINEHYNALPEDDDPNMEEDEVVFGLRDKVIANLTLAKLPGTGPLALSAESQDYDHDNLYHYQVLFKASFIDDTGSPWNPANGGMVTIDPPIQLVLNVDKVPFIEGKENSPSRVILPIDPSKIKR